MAFPTNVPMESPGYVIYRDSPPGQPYDPTAAPVFFPAKNSDELFDALRAKFPHVKTHSERMRDAVIEFLIEERQAELTQNTPPMPSEFSATSPWPHSWPSMSSGSGSVWSSPETINLSTPNFGNSPQPQIPQLARQFSTAGSTTGTISETGPSPSAIERMTGVFSLSTSAQPRQRTRRKMTEAEKIEYRKRRIVKACDKCAQRKRKCHHNETEMDSLAAKSQKVAKSRPQKPTVAVASTPPTPQYVGQLLSMSAFESQDGFAADMQLFDDFTNFFDEPVLEPSFANNGESDYWQFPEAGSGIYGDPMSNMPDAEQHYNLLEHQIKTSIQGAGPYGLRPAQATPDVNKVFKDGHTTRARGVDEEVDVMFKNPAHSQGVSSWTNNARGVDGLAHTGAEGTLIGSHDATHTAHVHDSTTQGLYASDGSTNPFATPMAARHASLANVVPTILYTNKAVNAFIDLLPSRTPSTSRTSRMIAIATLIRLGPRQMQDNTNATHADTASVAWAIKHGQVEAPRAIVDPDTEPGNRLPRFESATTGPLEGMSIGDYLRMKTNFDQVNHGGTALLPAPEVARTQKKFGFNHPALQEAGAYSSEESLASTSVPASGRLFTPQGAESAARPEGRPTQQMLGENLMRGPSPSSELYMLRKRLPSALHSVESANGVLLQTRARALISETQRGSEARPFALPTSAHIGGGVQPNGGAYQRADAYNYNRPDTMAQDGHAEPRPSPAQSGNPRANGFSWDLNRMSATEVKYMGAHSFAPTMAGTEHPSTVNSEPESRLCDHVRRRDHFGRSERERYQSLVALGAALGGLLLLAAVATAFPHVNSTLLLVAFLAPLSDVEGFRDRTLRFWGPLSGAITPPQALPSGGMLSALTVFSRGKAGCGVRASSLHPIKQQAWERGLMYGAGISTQWISASKRITEIPC